MGIWNRPTFLCRASGLPIAPFQSADEAFADLLAKHGVPIDLKAALRKSAADADGDKPAAAGRRKSTARTHRHDTRSV